MNQTPVLAIKATNIELTPAVAAAIDKRFGALAKFVRPKEDQEVRMQVEIGRKNKAKSKADDLFFAELNVLVGGVRHRAVATSRDLYDAIDDAKAEMTAHLSRAHERAKDERRKGGRAVKEAVRSAPASAPATVMPRALKPAKKAPKKKAAAAPKKPVAKKVSPRSRVHGTKNTRGAGNRPPQMKPTGKRK
jgi:ribosomal subunit interface protein